MSYLVGSLVISTKGFITLKQAFFLDDHAKTQGEKTQGFTKTQGNFPPKTQGIGGFPPHFQQNSRYRRFLRLPERVEEQKYIVDNLY